MPVRIGITAPLRGAYLWASLVGIYSILPMVNHHLGLIELGAIPGSAGAALSAALVLFIAFRINHAYDRWWEARKLWGSLVNVSRNMAVKIRELGTTDAEERRAVRDVIVAFCLGLKDHLRDEPDLQRLPGFEGDPAEPAHLPSHVVRRLYRIVGDWQTAGRLSDERLWVLDSEMRHLLDICGACERIKNTLMSVSWRSFTRQIIVVILLLLPWGLVDSLGIWTLPLTMFVSYFVIAGEIIARYVEEPFGREEDHLDLDSICDAIDLSVSEVLLSEE